MALTALNVSKEYELVSISDPSYRENVEDAKNNGATIFVCRLLTKGEVAEIEDRRQEAATLISEDMQTVFRQHNNKQNLIAFRRGVTNVINMLDSKGNVVKFETEVTGTGSGTRKIMSEGFADMFTSSVINEIGREIRLTLLCRMPIEKSH